MPGSRASATLFQDRPAVNVKTFALWRVKTSSAGWLAGLSGNLTAPLLASEDLEKFQRSENQLT